MLAMLMIEPPRPAAIITLAAAWVEATRFFRLMSICLSAERVAVVDQVERPRAARVIDQDVQAAEVGRRSRHGGADGVAVQHVGRDDERAAALAADQFGHDPGRLDVDVGDGDVGAELGQADGYAPARSLRRRR